ncbi:hypothetical protein B0H13DRAFT_2651321 [Mycena leptocephala]|nr:hypothetical protein B0H13DRAFT_2651321 [Mycena leptocephala]
MAQNSPYRPGFVLQPQQQQQQYPQQAYDPRRQYPQYQPPRHPAYPQYQQPQQYYQQPSVPPQQYPYSQPQPHPQYAQPPPPRPRSSLGHAHSHSVPVAPGHHQFVNPPPLSPSALQAQAAQAQLQTRGRALPPPRRAETLPPTAPFDQTPNATQYPQQQQYYPSYAIPVPLNHSASSSSSRPLPTPTPSSGIPRSPAKHHSLDLGRFPPPPQSAQPVPPLEKQAVQPVAGAQPSPPETASQIRRRASPPRFTGGSGSWSEPSPLPAPTTAAPAPASKASEFKDLLSGGSTLESGKFVPLWKRGLITDGSTSTAASSGRPLPSAPASGTSSGSGLKRGGSLHIRAPASTSVAKSPSPSPEPDESESESEVEEQGNAQEESEESESESEISGSEDASSDAGSSNAQLPSTSPQYGIRDLPRPPSIDARASTLPQPPEIRRSAFDGRSAPGMIEGGGSRTLMFAAAGLNGTPVKDTWPAGVPPLPRTPSIREVDDLEDSPPVSTIRRGVGKAPAPVTNSASSFSGPPSSPLSKPPSFSFGGPPSSTTSSSQIPSFSFSGPPSPPTSSKVPSLSFTGPSSTPQIPSISFPDETRVSVPQINLPGDDDDDGRGPKINIQEVDSKPVPQIFEVPGISFSGPSGPSGPPAQRSLPARPPTSTQRRGLACGGCGGSIVGRIVNAMGLRWHPECFRCTVCDELLEHVSSYERDGKPYCHLDYHENFAPRCYSCKTAIVEERFISLDDPQLGKRTYHEQHFFCAECGDPFLPPSIPASKGEIAFSGDGAFVSDDVGFTVYRGHPYCEACHVRLRLPKCKRCKRSIRDGDEAVEALGGKWCWGCFCCAGCEKPFEDPSFFEREGKPWCEPCFSILLRNEL